MTQRTVLIGLDGATFTILDRLMDDGTMPFLRRFVQEGARANLRSVVPPLTPPAWTSLATGRSPGHHGVFDFFGKVSPESRHIQFTTSQHIGCETLWSLASRQGQKVTVLNFPLTFPPPKVNGYVVPGGWMPWRQLRLGCHPPGLYDELKSLPGFNARELAMDPSQEAKAIEGCRQEEYEDWIDLHIRREQHWFGILQHLMTKDPSDLTAILFDGVDKIQHLCWRFLDEERLGPSPTAWEQRIRERCLAYFRQLDELLEEIVHLSGQEATVVVGSDHGFGPTDEIFHINTWLEHHGYLAWVNEGDSAGTETEGLGINALARHVYEMDWERTTAYATTPTSNGVHIAFEASSEAPGGNDHGSPGVSSQAYQRFRNRLISALRSYTDEAGQPVVTRVWTREEAFSGPYQHLAPDLTLALRDGGHMSILQSDTILRPREDVRGSHRPEGVFIAGGKGVRSGVSVPELSILDVTPLLVWSMGLPIPVDFEGHLPEEILDAPSAGSARGSAAGAIAGPPASGQARDTVAGAAAPAVDSAGDTTEEGVVLSDEDEAVMVERLRALGYIE